MSLKIVHISDTHFSRRPSVFQYNWEIAVDLIRDLAPDLVVCTGDIAMNAATDPDDLVYAREQLDRLGVEVLAVPGNHDVGDLFVGHDPIDAASIDAYRRVFGPDFWAVQREGWLLVGLNAQLSGSGLADESDQLNMLKEALAGANGMPVAVFNHKALHLGAPDVADPPGWTIPQPQRAELRDLLIGHGNVRLYASGHFHRYREMEDAGIRLIWAPSPAFITNHPKFAPRGGLVKSGFTRIGLAPDGTVDAAFVDDNAMIQFDLQNAINDGGAARRHWASKVSIGITRTGT